MIGVIALADVICTIIEISIVTDLTRSLILLHTFYFLTPI